MKTLRIYPNPYANESRTLSFRSPAKLPGWIFDYKLKSNSLDGPRAEFVSIKKIAIVMRIVAGRPPAIAH